MLLLLLLSPGLCAIIKDIYKKINSQIHPRLLALFEFKLIRYSKVHEKQHFVFFILDIKKKFSTQSDYQK